jgi:hypothetical protein
MMAGFVQPPAHGAPSTALGSNWGLPVVQIGPVSDLAPDSWVQNGSVSDYSQCIMCIGG